ncbi:MAG: carbonic anhydrase family protein [Pseudomonadota bacterium]
MRLGIVALVLVSLSLQACSNIKNIFNEMSNTNSTRNSRDSTAAKPTEKSGQSAGNGQWGYGPQNGPEKWGYLSPYFATCQVGTQQSPIDIRYPELWAMPSLRFNYVTSNAEIINNGHTIQIAFSAGGSARVGGAVYNLVEINFHTPSEEKINGNAFPMSAHFIHKSAEDKIAIVAVMFMLGQENKALKPLFDMFPIKQGDKNFLSEVNPNIFLPPDHGYYAYLGSLTTPPCTEGVRWNVLTQPIEISEAQLEGFRKLYPMNARPVQSINGRRVFEGM